MLRALFLLAAATVTAQPDPCAIPDALSAEFLAVYESAARMPDLIYGIANERPDEVVRRTHAMIAVADQIYDMRLGYDFGDGLVLPLRLFLVETEFALRAEAMYWVLRLHNLDVGAGGTPRIEAASFGASILTTQERGKAAVAEWEQLARLSGCE